MRALAYSKTFPDGSFATAKQTTGDLAKDTYLMRLLFLFAMHQDVKETAGLTLEDACSGLEPYFVEKNSSTFNSIRSLQHVATTISKGTGEIPIITYPNPNTYELLSFKGDLIEFRHVISMIRQLEDDLIVAFEKVNLGCPMPLDREAWIKDDLSNSHVGYSFVTEPRNGYQAHTSVLSKHIVSTFDLQTHFVNALEERSIVWNRHSLRAYLLDVVQFIRLVLIRCEMVAGAPIRGTELTAMTFQNTETRRRNLFVLNNHLCLLGQYSKTTAITKQDRVVVHALDAVTTDVLTRYLVYIHPFVQFAATQIFCTQSKEHLKALNQYRSHLFISFDRLFTTDDLSSLIREYTTRFLGVGLTVQSWRHVSIAFQQHLCRDLLRQQGELDYIDISSAAQAGHSHAIESRLYAQSSDGVHGANAHDLQVFCDISVQYQIVAKVVPSGVRLAYEDARHGVFESLLKSGKICAPSSGSRSSMAKEVAEILWPMIEKKLDDLQTKLRGTLVEDNDTPDEELEYVEISTSSAAVPRTDMGRDVYLKTLRKLLMTPDADWTSSAQIEAILQVAQRQDDVLVVMPTGSGKTLVPLIPAMKETEYTIVVVMLVSILQDLERRMTAMKVPFYTYAPHGPSGLPPDTRIILTTINQAQSSHFQARVKDWYTTLGVARYVVDEGHYGLTNLGFRPELVNPSSIRCIPVPLVVLSATVPPHLEQTLAKLWGLTTSYLSTRCTTDRPELQYSVTAVWHLDLVTQVSELVKREERNYGPRDRTLVFVHSKHIGRELATKLGCNLYHGDEDMTREERHRIETLWRSGTHKTMICTSAFSAGNDYPHIRLVLHAGTPGSMIDFIQEVGRGGRDHQPAKSVLLYTGDNTWMKKDDGPDTACRTEMNRYGEAKDPCRRLYLNTVNDGVQIACKDVPNCQLCDLCRLAKVAGTSVIETLSPQKSPTLSPQRSSILLPQRSPTLLPQRSPTLLPQNSHTLPQQKSSTLPFMIRAEMQRGQRVHMSSALSASALLPGRGPAAQSAMPTFPNATAIDTAFAKVKEQQTINRREPQWVVDLKRAVALSGSTCPCCSNTRELVNRHDAMQCPSLNSPCPPESGYRTFRDIFLDAFRKITHLSKAHANQGLLQVPLSEWAS
ncbi:hypothetical protein BDZ89DRAFT_261214 [Hymenopellis radicata]|nr:hypothetical protein BDZ89DRAFT_261214 [Hymenopellis radicata]